MNTKVTLISQASLIIETSDTVIWTDPWLSGKAFMESWSLLPPADWNDSYLEKIQFVWVSHEHPDHFHLPTLKGLPKQFKERVTLLFQKNNSGKMPAAFKNLGFKNIKLLKHRKIEAITADTKVHCCQFGPTPDSSLAVINNGYTLLNLNDCEANSRDCKLLLKDLDKVDLLLNQFSMAGYRGHFDFETHLKAGADSILENMLQNHVDLKAASTIPIASFVYFSDEDNRFMNRYMNTPMKVREHFDKVGLHADILYPGDTFVAGAPFDSAPALEKYRRLYDRIDELEFRKPPQVSLDELKSVIEERHRQIKDKYPSFIINRLKPLVVRINDLDKTVQVCLRDGSFREVGNDYFDLVMGSEAFHYAFKYTWGISTIGVGAKYLIKSKKEVWKWYKIVGTLNNSQLYLKPRYLFSKNNFNFLMSRLDGGVNQMIYKWKRMKS